MDEFGAGRPGGVALRAAAWALASALVGLCLVGWWLDASLAGRDRGVAPRGRADALRLHAETPVLFDEGDGVRSAPRPPAEVALTFSGGLDDRWVGAVTRLLARHDAHATFFLTGQALVAHPDRARVLKRAGHELGANGYSEVDLAALDDWQVRLHLSVTSSLMAARSGEQTRLFRPPGSQPLRGLDAADLDVVGTATDEGYTVVLADTVASLWDDPDPAEVVRSVLPAEGTSSVIEFPTPPEDHRDEALDALEYVVAALGSRDTALVTVTDYTSASGEALHPPASASERRRGAALAVAMPLLGGVRSVVHALAVVLLVLGAVRLVLGAFLAWRSRRTRTSPAGSHPPSSTVPVTVLIAARDEADCITRTVDAVAASRHRALEILVVDDGSTDGTAALAQEALDRSGRPGAVLAQEGLGKPVALNAGIMAASHDVVVCIDADTLVEPTTIDRLVEPFAEAGVGAVSGHVLVGNAAGLLGRFQRAEYAVGCTIERGLLNAAGFMTCISGAVGAYRRDALAGVGGFSSDTCAEDTDLALALQRAGWKAVYAPDAKAATTVPLTVRGLWTQRVRWSLGVAQSMWKHRGAAADRSSSGWIGRRALPYLLVFGSLSVLGPIVDAVAVFAVLTARVDQLVLVWAGLMATTTGLTALAFRLDGQPMRRAWIVPLQTLLYRPFLYGAQLRALQLATFGLRPAWRRRRVRPLRSDPPVVTPVLQRAPVPALAAVPVPAAVSASAPVAGATLLPPPPPVPVGPAAPATDWAAGAFRLFAAAEVARTRLVVDLRDGRASAALLVEEAVR